MIFGDADIIMKLLEQIRKLCKRFGKNMRFLIPVRQGTHGKYLQDLYYGKLMRPLTPDPADIKMYGFDFTLKSAVTRQGLFEIVTPYLSVGVC